MRPAVQHIASLCPEVSEDLVREHIKRLEDEYFERFDLERIVAHLRGLSRLSPERPVEVLLERGREGYFDCTVLAYDYPSVFSLITGVLCGVGASIISGDVFTYAKAIERESLASPRTRLWRPASRRYQRRRIIDHFWCSVDTDVEDWEELLRERLTSVVSLLERGDKNAVDEAKQRVNELVTERLLELDLPEQPVLYPVELDVDNDSGPFTRLTVVAQDTPAFLYSFSNALALQGCSIERVRIRTVQGRVRDEIDFVDASGMPVTDPSALDRIQLCVLLTKQFTYFLDRAPDPYTALSRFEQLVEQFLKLPGSAEWVSKLSDPRLMEELALLLGASDFLWEDFIRLQYEALLPILAPHLEGEEISDSSATIPERLAAALEGAERFEETIARLNAYKDQEIFLIDLDHILKPEVDFRQLSERLTALAESVIRTASTLLHEEFVRRHGSPRTVAGLEASFAVFGLGKLGGGALGYASDIEVLVVYSDNGRTDGEKPLTNTEFFSQLARELPKVIRAKRAGIFEVDLRLRPYGEGGPMASSLEQFCRYYGPGGDAHSAERLALVRLRAIAGDLELGARVERLRDEYLYEARAVDPDEVHALREKQFEEKRRAGAYNAKFSPGALVDLEYTVQLLQVFYGGKHPELRTPSIHRALGGLKAVGVVDREECRRLVAAYDFLRRLINGLRMLRGTAKDLFLPALDSDEFLHLARRMGYEKKGDLGPEQQLHLDFETHTAVVRTFVKVHLGPDSLPGPPMGSVVDLVLAEDAAKELRNEILRARGFRKPERAYKNLRRMAGEGQRLDLFAGLAILACDALRLEPDPDMALNNWERFLHALESPEEHYRLLLSQPRRLAILLGIFSRSQFLADTLIRNPEFFDWVTAPVNLKRVRKRSELERELRTLAKECTDPASWLSTLRVFRRREMLRIGTRDMCLKVPIEEVLQDLTTLAEATVEVALEESWKRLKGDGQVPAGSEDISDRLSVLAFGKLGASELNYSSDIDLLAVYDDTGTHRPVAAPLARLVERVRADLSAQTDEGHAYRVDLRLRPWGGSGEIASSIQAIEKYYREKASLWEIQALLKLRPIAGNLQVGYELLERVRPLLLQKREPEVIIDSIDRLRREAVLKTLTSVLGKGVDIKNGTGGIRDVEFLVQGLELVHAPDHPALFAGNTLQGIEALGAEGILPESVVRQLRDDYVFLRRVEHYLQILHDRQTHTVPVDESELEALGKRVLGPDARTESFTEKLEGCLDRVHRAHVEHLLRHSQRVG